MEFITKIGDFFNGLNESDLWKYIQSVVAKLVKLLKLEKEDETAAIIEDIFAAE